MDTFAASAVHPRARPGRSWWVDATVDVGFALLLLVCTLRYFSNHDLAGQGTVVLALAVGVTVTYAFAVLARRGRGETAGLLLASLLWVPLVVLAPSYGWCAFALFFAVHRVLRGWAALGASLVIVVSVSVGLLLMSQGQDLGLVLGPLFGGTVLSLVYRALEQSLDEQRTLLAEVVATRSQLAEAAREAGAQAERSRVASELHDTAVQRTASALLLLETADRVGDPSADRSAVHQARDVLRDALAQTRRVLHGFPQGDGERRVSFTSGLAELTAEHGAALTVTGDGAEPAPALAHALLRVVQEALINVRKHAGDPASSDDEPVRAQVTVDGDSATVRVRITDHGRGFFVADGEKGGASQGYGIRAMRWRVESLGGTLHIESSEGAGTTVTATVPRDGQRGTATVNAGTGGVA
ncbi:MAG: sensor histidine kinase [Mycetocola sp.]